MTLSLATLASATVPVPSYDPAVVAPAILHFGPGAFHRAHQADFIDRLLATDPRWGIIGVSLHSANGTPAHLADSARTRQQMLATALHEFADDTGFR